jgi:hypothetical protein
MKVYFKQEKLRFAKKSSLSLRFVYKEYIFRIFALIEIPHKKFNRVKYLLKNYKRLKFTLDIFGYEDFNDFNVIIENDKMIKYIVNNSDKRVHTPKERTIVREWKRKNTITT